MKKIYQACNMYSIHNTKKFVISDRLVTQCWSLILFNYIDSQRTSYNCSNESSAEYQKTVVTKEDDIHDCHDVLCVIDPPLIIHHVIVYEVKGGYNLLTSNFNIHINNYICFRK
jgi:hypothetical protein